MLTITKYNFSSKILLFPILTKTYKMSSFPQSSQSQPQNDFVIPPASQPFQNKGSLLIGPQYVFSPPQPLQSNQMSSNPFGFQPQSQPQVTFGLPNQLQPNPQPLFGIGNYGPVQQTILGGDPNWSNNANNSPFIQQVPMGNKSSTINNNVFAQQIPSNAKFGINNNNLNSAAFPIYGGEGPKMLEEIVQKEVKSDEKEKEPIVSIIITIYAGASYDNLFRDVQQVVVGGRITLYSLSLLEVTRFYDCWNKGKAETDNQGFNDVMNKILA